MWGVTQVQYPVPINMTYTEFVDLFIWLECEYGLTEALKKLVELYNQQFSRLNYGLYERCRLFVKDMKDLEKEIEDFKQKAGEQDGKKEA